MSLTNDMGPADVAAVMGNHNGGGNNNGGWGGDWASWIILFLIFALFGGRGFGGFGGGGIGSGSGVPCATQADVRSAVDQQTLISKIDQQTYGMADSFTALNNTLNSNFRGIDNAICNIGFQNQQGFSNLGSQLAACCCDIERSIDGNTNSGTINAMNLDRRISDCCCNLEKMNMQNRFDAQAYNCDILQKIDASSDRILKYLQDEKTQNLRDENFALRLQASQRAQDDTLKTYIGGQFAYYNPRPVPSFDVPAPYPYCCGNGGNGYGNCGGGCGNGYGVA